MRDYIGNQTQFSTEEPFFENPSAIPEEPKEYKPPVPFFRRRKTIVGLTIGLILLGLGALLGYSEYVAWLRRIQESPVIAEPTRPPITYTELAQEAEVLRQQLKSADPEERELIFPPIDMQLRMEEVKR